MAKHATTRATTFLPCVAVTLLWAACGNDTTRSIGDVHPFPGAAWVGQTDVRMPDPPDILADAAPDLPLTDVLPEVIADLPTEAWQDLPDEDTADATTDVEDLVPADLPFADTTEAWDDTIDDALPPDDTTPEVEEVVPDGLDEAFADAVSDDLPPEATDEGPDFLGGDVRLRVMAANLTSTSSHDYDAGHGLRIIRGLVPDIVLINEFRYGSNTTEDLAAFMELAFGSVHTYTYYRGPGGLPNGVLSRYPILEAGTWDDLELSDREFDWARIDVPGARDLWAVSIHFKAGSGATEEARRVHEGQQLFDPSQKPPSGYLAALPENDYVVVGGDFNTYARDEACILTLGDYLMIDGPFPDDGAEPPNDNTNSLRNHPYDWVLADADLDAQSIPVVIGEQMFDDGLVFDSRIFVPLSDVTPVEEGDSAAPYMQHMAVIRDFWLP